MPPDAMVLEKREAGGCASGRMLGELRGDWAEMRVLQWFRGVRPHQVLNPTPTIFKPSSNHHSSASHQLFVRHPPRRHSATVLQPPHNHSPTVFQPPPTRSSPATPPICRDKDGHPSPAAPRQPQAIRSIAAAHEIWYNFIKSSWCIRRQQG